MNIVTQEENNLAVLLRISALKETKQTEKGTTERIEDHPRFPVRKICSPDGRHLFHQYGHLLEEDYRIVRFFRWKSVSRVDNVEN